MFYPRKIKRETMAQRWDAGKHRRVVVTIDPMTGVVGFRLKGCRRAYELPAAYLWQHAVQKTVALEKARKAKDRKRTRRVRRGRAA